jgi:hypothetical protein
MNNTQLTFLAKIADWHDARRPWKDNHSGERSTIGKRIVATASQQLTPEAGERVTHRAPDRTIRFCQRFPNKGIVSALSTQLRWTRAPKGGKT